MKYLHFHPSKSSPTEDLNHETEHTNDQQL